LSVLQEVNSGAAPWRLQSLLIRVGGAPDVHISLIASGGQGSTSAVAKVGGSTPEQLGERSTAVEAADRTGTALELAGSKRAALKQGSSGRPAKKSRVRSKM
jgi:hypothetical protein